MLLLSAANDVYFDVDIEVLEEGLWPGQDQIMMIILMSRAGLKLMLMLMQILSFSKDIEAEVLQRF